MNLNDVIKITKMSQRSELLIRPDVTPTSWITKSQYFVLKVSFVGSIGGLLFGYDMGVISQALPLLKDDFDMTVEQEELFTSLLVIGGIMGCLIGGYICDIFGRRFTMMIVAGIFILGSIILSLSNSLPSLYVGRFIVGCGVTISAIADVSYLSEISPEKYRGAIVGCNELLITIGLLFAYFTGYLLSEISTGWRWMFAIPLFLSLLWLVALQFVPESPTWYLLQNMNEKALLIYEARVDTEIEARTDFDLCKLNVLQMKSTSQKSFYEIIKIWKFSIITSVILMIFQNMSGNYSVLTYSPELFTTVGFGTDASKYGAIILGIVKVISTLISMYFVDKIGRKKLLVTGVIGMCFSLLGILIFIGNENSNFPILTLFFICSLVAFFSFGYGPLGWLITSELFSDDVRGRGIGFANIASQISSLVAVATFLSLLTSVGTRWSFFIYLSICFSSLCFIVLFIPETKNKIPPELLRLVKLK